MDGKRQTILKNKLLLLTPDKATPSQLCLFRELKFYLPLILSQDRNADPSVHFVVRAGEPTQPVYERIARTYSCLRKAKQRQLELRYGVE